MSGETSAGSEGSSRTVTWEARAQSIKTDNKLITSKYTPLTFVPYNLFEQFQKQANVYFLFMSILMAVPDYVPLFLGTIKAWSTAMTLFLMMLVSAVVAALDDYARHKSDEAVNNQQADVLRDQRGELAWERLRVGHIVLVKNDREIPADLLILAHSGDENCFVSTANLDGETNLKPKVTIPLLAEKFKPEAAARAKGSNAAAGEGFESTYAQIKRVPGTVEAEAPSNQIYVFSGKVTVGEVTASAGIDNLLLRGTTLRNTVWCIGLVLYTGKDTRMVMNSRKVPSKQSNLERVINRAMWVIIAVQVFISLTSDIIFYFQKDFYEKRDYLYPDGFKSDLIVPDLIAYFLTFFVLYSNLMPVSLYATMELCNAAHARFINSDRNMRDDARDLNAKANGTNLCNELGQISHVFSDKTGTLTQNVMELVAVGVGSELYGERPNAAPPPSSGNSGSSSGADGPAGGDHPFWSSVSPWEALKQDCPLLECLAVAHTVMLNREGKLEAENPDEAALVRKAGELGWSLRKRSNAEITVAHPGKEDVTYKILAINAFNSTRKRMSVVVERQRDKKNILFIKGADNVMLEVASKKGAQTEQQLKGLSTEGLRTLAVGQRYLDDAFTKKWLDDYAKAKTDLDARAEKLEQLAVDIERDVEIVGVTGIEDKLQENAPQVIETLRKAGIKLWVLTGDKLETARSIGFSTKVLDTSMDIVTIELAEANDGAALEGRLQQVLEAAREEREAAMIVTGEALAAVIEKPEFLVAALKCKVVIACRVSPLQKGDVVRLVREGSKTGRKPITLSIGDGANDVPMIQEAHVGVGVFGYEGQQAVNAADFAIAQFQYLEELLLVHGRWNYRRMSKLTLYTFWRNAVQVLLMFYYTFYSGFSGTALFEDNLRITFNPLLSIPILATGVFDQDVHRKIIRKHPDLYESGREGIDLNSTTIALSIISAFTHSVILWAYTLWSYNDFDALGTGDYYSFTTVAYTLLIVSMTYRVAFLTTTWNMFSYLSLAATLLMYLFFLVFYNYAAKWVKKFMYQVPLTVLEKPILWIVVLGAPATAFMIDSLVWYLFHRLIARLPGAALNQRIDEATNATKETKGKKDAAEDSEKLTWREQLWQQKLPSKQCTLAKSPYFMGAAAVVGLLMLLVGWVDQRQALGTECMVARYAGDLPGCSLAESVVGNRGRRDEGCAPLEDAGGGTYSRTFEDKFSGRLYVYYELYPFYQNHAMYLKDDELRLRSPFSDVFTFTLENESLTTKPALDFESDRDVFSDITTDLLREWNRPAAMPLLRKSYAKMDVDIPAGGKLSVKIVDNYDVQDSEKRILLTMVGPLGGRDLSLSHLLIFFGAFVTCVALLIIVCERCRKAPPEGSELPDRCRKVPPEGSSASPGEAMPLIGPI